MYVDRFSGAGYSALMSRGLKTKYVTLISGGTVPGGLLFSWMGPGITHREVQHLLEGQLEEGASARIPSNASNSSVSTEALFPRNFLL